MNNDERSEPVALTYNQRRERIIEDYWAGRISTVRADEMLRDIDYQEKEATSGGTRARARGEQQ